MDPLAPPPLRRHANAVSFDLHRYGRRRVSRLGYRMAPGIEFVVCYRWIRDYPLVRFI
jgi:hypothetical protein